MAIRNYRIIRALFEFNDRLDPFRDRKNELVINFFKETKIDLEDADAFFPDAKFISQQSGVPQQKVYSLIKNLYLKLLQSLFVKPFEVKRFIHTICISPSWDELSKFKNKEFAEELKQKALTVQTVLPFVPRVGDTISFDFIEEHIHWDYGYVHSIKHDISASLQNIIIFVHPYEGYYHEWQRQKKQFEESLERQNRIAKMSTEDSHKLKAIKRTVANKSS